MSYVINPIVLPPLAFWLMLVHFRAPGLEVLQVTAVTAFFFALVPLAFAMMMVRSGRAQTIEIRDRSARIAPLLITLGSGVAGWAGIALLARTGRGFLLLAAVCFVLNVALSLAVTSRWKISLHLIGLAGFLASGLFVSAWPWPWTVGTTLSPSWLVPACVLVPLLMWARVRSGAHTWAQVMVGAGVGFVVTAAELILLTPLALRLAG